MIVAPIEVAGVSKDYYADTIRNQEKLRSFMRAKGIDRAPVYVQLVYDGKYGPRIFTGYYIEANE